MKKILRSILCYLGIHDRTITESALISTISGPYDMGMVWKTCRYCNTVKIIYIHR